MKKFLSLSLTLIAIVCAADSPCCKAVVLVGSSKDILEENLDALEGLVVSGVEVPGGVETLEKSLLPLFANRPIDFEMIGQIKKAIAAHYEEQGSPLSAVYVPEQSIAACTLQVVVITGCLDQLNVTGNCWTPSSFLQNYFEIDSGETIREKILRRDLEFMNRNPFRHVSAIMSPGSAQGTTDITLLVQERRQTRFYAGADNTGVVTTGRQRLFAGFNWGKAFGLDHVFAYQYTTSYDFSDFQAHTVQYQALLSWRHILNVYGGYSSVHAHLPFPTMRTNGASGQASLRYTIPLTPTRTFTHELTGGFDYKRTNNTLEFSELFLKFSKNVNLTQFALEYKCEKTSELLNFDFNLRAFFSPFRWIPDQTTADYQSLRPGAKPEYFYCKAAVNTLFYLPRGFYWNTLLRGQASSQNLLPSEQQGIGGYDTVRGYNERQLNMDNSVLASTELRSPYLPVFQKVCRNKIHDAFQALVFCDFGWGCNYQPIPNEASPDYLLSAGPGLRYTLDPYIAARIDWGIKLHNKKAFTGGSSMVNFSCVISY